MSSDPSTKTKKQYYPRIAEAIRALGGSGRWALRSQLADYLIYKTGLTKTLQSTGPERFAEVANMIDWFSADWTRLAPSVIRYTLEFERRKLRDGGSITYAYRVQQTGAGDLPPIGAPNAPPESYPEGMLRQVLVNAYERSAAARAQCIKTHGVTCKVCGFDFEAVYGTIGKGYVHVHHVVPLALIKKTYHVNPAQDLVPVCANCHAMLHRGGDPWLSVQDLQQKVKNRRTRQ